jgi:hypothetical protein
MVDSAPCPLRCERSGPQNSTSHVLFLLKTRDFGIVSYLLTIPFTLLITIETVPSGLLINSIMFLFLYNSIGMTGVTVMIFGVA